MTKLQAVSGYTAKITFKPAMDGDPIPWSVHVYYNDQWLAQRWRGTREECVEWATEFKHEHETGEWGSEEIVSL